MRAMLSSCCSSPLPRGRFTQHCRTSCIDICRVMAGRIHLLGGMVVAGREDTIGGGGRRAHPLGSSSRNPHRTANPPHMHLAAWLWP